VTAIIRDPRSGLVGCEPWKKRTQVQSGTSALKYAETVASYQTFLGCDLLSTRAAAQAESGFMDQAVQLDA
jgi:hypothetical protein